MNVAAKQSVENTIKKKKSKSKKKSSEFKVALESIRKSKSNIDSKANIDSFRATKVYGIESNRNPFGGKGTAIDSKRDSNHDSKRDSKSSFGCILNNKDKN